MALSTPASSATGQRMYLLPSVGTFHVGDEVDVQVRLDTGTQSVNVAEAKYFYPTDKLTFLGYDQSASAFGDRSLRRLRPASSTSSPTCWAAAAPGPSPAT